MPTVIHTTFADRYLLRKVRAIADVNARKDPSLAALRILGLLQRRCGVPSWAGFYVRSRGALRLRRFREDPVWEFPRPYRPERTLDDPSRGVEIRHLPGLGMADLRVPVLRDGRAAGLLRVFLPETDVERAPEPPLLEEIAQAVEPLCSGRPILAAVPVRRRAVL